MQSLMLALVLALQSGQPCARQRQAHSMRPATHGLRGGPRAGPLPSSRAHHRPFPVSCSTALSAVCAETGAGGVVCGGGGGKLKSDGAFTPLGAGGGCTHTHIST